MMITLRSTLFWTILAVVTPPYWLIVMLAAPCTRRVRYRVITGWTRFITWLARRLLRIEYVVRGRHNIPREPCVILSKHQSAWETLAYSSIFPPHVYVVKRELLWIPFFGWGLALMSPIAIDRAAQRRAIRRLTKLGGERLKQGFSIMIYPEGTRVAVGRRGAYKLGGAAVAVENGARVLPVAHNAGLVWPRHSFVKYPGKVSIIIGPVIETAGLTAAQVTKRVEDWIENEMANLTPPGMTSEVDATRAALCG
jgi:1-acyl-sn-glycerol-3-phosphate acyltransferase